MVLIMHTLYGGRALALWGVILGSLSGIYAWLLRPSLFTAYDRLWPETLTRLYYAEALYLSQLSLVCALLIFATRQRSQPLQWMFLVSLKGRWLLCAVYVVEWLCGYVALMWMFWLMQSVRAWMPYDPGIRLSIQDYGIITLWYHFLYCVLQWVVKQRRAYAYMAMVLVFFLASITLNHGHTLPLHPLMRLVSYVMPSLFFHAHLGVFGSLRVMGAISVLLMGWLIHHERTKDYIHHV